MIIICNALTLTLALTLTPNPNLNINPFYFITHNAYRM